MVPCQVSEKIYLFKVNNRNTIVKGVKNKDSIATSVSSFWCLCVNFEHISHLFLVFLSVTLTMYLFSGLELLWIGEIYYHRLIWYHQWYCSS